MFQFPKIKEWNKTNNCIHSTCEFDMGAAILNAFAPKKIIWISLVFKFIQVTKWLYS